MSSFAGLISIAQRRNKVKTAELASDLERLEKEQKGEIRNHNTIKQRFKAKYSKLDNYSGKTKEGSDVRMYETHNPGFCYKRNGECRIPQMSVKIPVVDYEELRDLLFTNEELDTEKVLCLHVLTAHKSETLAPFEKPTGFISKEMCPVERLLERSKKKRPEIPILKLLPLYILDVDVYEVSNKKSKAEPKVLISDGRLAARVLINEKIQIIVATVLTALKGSSQSKLELVQNIAHDSSELIKVLEKPMNQLFLRSLQHKTIINSCESFYLTTPFKTQYTELKLPHHAKILESVVNNIRLNVLQLPSKNISTRKIFDDLGDDLIPLFDKKTAKSGHSSYASIPLSSTASMVSKFLSNKETPASSFKKNTFDVNEAADKLNHPSTSKDISKTVSVDFKEEVIKDDEDESVADTYYNRPDNKNRTRRNISIKDAKVLLTNIDYDNLANLLQKKINQAMMRDVAALKAKSLESYYESIDQMETELDNRSQCAAEPACVVHARSSIRRSNCSACLQKWKQPLPSPKTSGRYNIPVLDQFNYKIVKTDSIHMISTIIDREFMKLEADKQSEKFRRKFWNQKSTELKRSPSKITLETVNLDAIDLAKINQEIRLKETEYKLEKFLRGERL